MRMAVKGSAWVAAAALTVAGCASSGGVSKGGAAAGAAAKPKAADAAQAPVREYTPEEEMAAWTAVSTPGPEHARMAAESGDWDVVTKMWMDPSAPPQESPARARIWMIHGARFQMMEYEGSMMGMPFRGTGITGYDNFLKKYVGSWCDSMGTMLMHSEGTFDAAAQALTLESDWLDPLGRRVHMRQVGTRSDDDHMVWTFHSAMAGKPETRFMELHFTRRR